MPYVIISDEQQFREQQQTPVNHRKTSVENGLPSNKRKSSRLSSLLSIFSSK